MMKEIISKIEKCVFLKVRLICLMLIIISLSFNYYEVYAQEVNYNEKIRNYNIENVIEVFDSYTQESEFKEFNSKTLLQNLIESNGKVNSKTINTLLKTIFERIKDTLRETMTLFALIVLFMIISNIQFSDRSDVITIGKIIIYISLSTILVKNYLNLIVVFRDIISKLTIILQTVSTFLIGVVVATGKISSSTVIESVILSIANLITFLVEYVVIPCFSVSMTISVISRISNNIKLSKFSTIFRKASLYIFLTILGVFLSFLKLETSITTSMDGMTYKVAQDAVSNAVPVVGGFLSDSLDTVISSTKVIGKVGGVFSIICTTVIVLDPIIKIVSYILVYTIIIAISETLNADSDVKELLTEFTKLYKDMLGIIIGVMTIFVISTAIIMNIIGNIGG